MAKLTDNQVFEYYADDFSCLLYTSDAADERSSVDLGGRRIIKKNNMRELIQRVMYQPQMMKKKQEQERDQE